MIVATNLSFSVKNKPILHPMNLAIDNNEFCVVLGANGAGKSTLLHLLAGSIKPSSGQIIFENKNLEKWDLKELAQKRAFLQQASSLSAAFIVSEVLKLGRYPYSNESHEESEKLLQEVIEQFGLAPFQDTIFNVLSGGEKQRVQFARVLLQLKSSKNANHKSILFLDEPLNNLDINYQTEILQEAKNFVDEGKGTVIAVIHDLNLSYQFANRCLLLDQGKIIADGAVNELFNSSLLSQIFKTSINQYQSQEGLAYFFANNGIQKRNSLLI